jgi:mono/diheme cytochrome c family protein
VFYTPFLGLFGSLGGQLAESSQDWMRQNGQNGNEWVQILKSPAYPANIDAIDTALAEQGAQLFHELDLWSRDNPVQAPPNQGNGSCASCHGAYAPRYFNDPAYLASPVLEGQAGNVTPLSIIGTDPVRYNTNNEAMIKAGAVNFFGYPPLVGTDNDCSPIKYAGYLAPPLYGVWANAPYFHNGSVPNLWQVLQPSDRVGIWERVSTPKPSGWKGLWNWTKARRNKLVMNYDTNLGRAFDFDRVGWTYHEYSCQNIERTCSWKGCKTTVPPLALQCRDTGPLDHESTLTDMLNYLGDSLLGVFDFLNANVILAWNLFTPPDITPAQMEERKIYNTNHFGQGNKGHEFTTVLTDDERWALIEYMKTL